MARTPPPTHRERARPLKPPTFNPTPLLTHIPLHTHPPPPPNPPITHHLHFLCRPFPLPLFPFPAGWFARTPGYCAQNSFSRRTASVISSGAPQ